MPPRWRTYGSDQTGRCAGGGARPSEPTMSATAARGPAPRQCLEQDRLSTENVKPLRASVTEGDKEKGGTKITLDSAALSGSKIPALRGNDRRRGAGQFDARPARARARGVQ